MSLNQTFTSTDPSSNNSPTQDQYSVETRDGCHIIKGPVPLTDMAGLLDLGNEADVIDTQLAAHLGATLVFGSPEDCKTLREKLYIGHDKLILGPDTPMRQRIEDWLDRGEIGLSSLTMAYVAMGDEAHAMSFKQDFRKKPFFPHDADDLRRCRQLVEYVPEIREHFETIAGLYLEWERITSHWDELLDTMNGEDPGHANRLLDAIFRGRGP